MISTHHSIEIFYELKKIVIQKMLHENKWLKFFVIHAVAKSLLFVVYFLLMNIFSNLLKIKIIIIFAIQWTKWLKKLSVFKIIYLYSVICPIYY